MDWEAPADAWYVWAGASVLAVAMAGVALSLPTQPPPDAAQAANAIDRVGGTSLGGTASYEHDAEMVRFDPQGITVRNDGGTSEASISFGRLTPVYDNDSLQAVLAGADPTEQYAGPDRTDAWGEFYDDVNWSQDRSERPEWTTASGELRVRVIPAESAPPSMTGRRVILVDA